MPEWRPAEEFSELGGRNEQEFVGLEAPVLAVDDDRVMREFFKIVLEATSLKLMVAGSVDEAITELEHHGLDRFGCIVTDYSMPGQNGLDLVRWVKSRDPGLEVVLLTAEDDKETVKQALRAGAFDFLEKPVGPQELIKVVRSALHKTEFNREDKNKRYVIKSLIGKGGTGSVYIARDRHLNRKVALKRLTLDDKAGVDQEELLEEALRLAKLQHPNIVHIFDCGFDEQGAYLIMEYISGVSLEESYAPGEAWETGPLVRVAWQALNALSYAHGEGYVHLDIKPSNIMLTEHGGSVQHVKLIDFGISEMVGRSRLIEKRRKYIMGSPLYISPEQLQFRPADCRSDLYSLGCVLYLMASGQEAAASDSVDGVIRNHLTGNIPSLSSKAPLFPESLSEWIMGLLRKDPEERYPSANQARSDFVRRLEDLNISVLGMS
jgi:FixJ family two-component response regulator